MPAHDTDDNIAATDQLHGVAIIASSFNVDGLSSSKSATDAHDPFSDNAAEGASLRSYRGAIQELCLDLEMTRNRPLPVCKTGVKFRSERDVQLATKGAYVEPPNDAVGKPKLHGKKALKANIDVLRKGKSKSLMSAAENEEDDVVYLHHASFVRDQSEDPLLYIDPRCTQTLSWFEQQFCGEEVDKTRHTTARAVLIDISTDSLTGDVIAGRLAIYGKLQPDEHSTRNRLQLYVGKLRNKRDLLPRPDAPAPRGEQSTSCEGRSVQAKPHLAENLFAQKLRRSASMQDVRKSQPDQVVAKLSLDSDRAKSADKNPLKPRQGLARSQSTSAISTLGLNGGTSASHEASQKGPNVLKRKCSTSGLLQKPPNPLKRSRLTSTVLDRLQEEGEDADKLDIDDIGDSRTVRDASPTASIASRHSAATRNGNVTHAQLNGTSLRPPASNLTRSMSMPPVQQPKQASEPYIKPKRPPRAPSVAASDAGTDLLGTDDILITAITSRNKPVSRPQRLQISAHPHTLQILRKAVIAQMRVGGCNKDHPDHETVFATTYRGVQCQMVMHEDEQGRAFTADNSATQRERFTTQLLQEHDLSSSITAHLALYLPHEALMPTATATVHSVTAVHNVDSLD